METVVLASGSETRKSMLLAAGVSFEILPAAIDEEEIKAALLAEGSDSAFMAEALAEHKARVVSRKLPTALVIGSDQILECGNNIYSKPVDVAAAKDQLSALRGKDHELISSVVVYRNNQRLWHHTDRALLRMRVFSDEFLDSYVSELGAELFQGPGSYRIEGQGIQLFSKITGDHFTILGLPLLPLLDYLRLQGAIAE
ncbi:MAG: septum formation protein Maf [Alphaproteobacteria bacterium]|nr:septum formation protein Maf [Alphaproteobacteria bacterium]